MAKIYIDYTLASRLDREMGREKFIGFLEKHVVITVDKQCYDFLLMIQDKKTNKGNE